MGKFKDFIKKVKSFSLLYRLLNKKIDSLESKVEWKTDLIKYHQGRLEEAENLKIHSLREIAKIADEIKEVKNKIDDLCKIL